jgi:mlo protein
MGESEGGGEGTRALDQTPTWAVVAVCAVIVVASILLEGILHHLGQVRPHKPPFFLSSVPISPSL